MEQLYREWYFPRPALADQLLSALLHGTGDPVALLGDRRIGKTTFLMEDFLPHARTQGFCPIYIDLWQHRSEPLEAINYALQEGIDNFEVPSAKIKRRLATHVKKLSLAGGSIDFGEEPTRRRPTSAYVLVDWLLRSLIRSAQRPVLMVIDEMQELGSAKDGENILSSLRAAVTANNRACRVLCTGSSPVALRELFSRSRAAFYEGASIQQFPKLGDDFLAFIAATIKVRFRVASSVKDLADVFTAVHQRPRALIDIVLLHYAGVGGKFDIHATADRYLEQAMGDVECAQRWAALSPLHQLILSRLVKALELTSLEARIRYGTKAKPLSPGSVTSALTILERSRVIARDYRAPGRFQIDDPLFGEWIKRKGF